MQEGIFRTDQEQDEWVRRIVAAAPPLSPAQRVELAALAASASQDEQEPVTLSDAAA